MRGPRNDQPMMLAWIDLEARVPRDHPLRPIKQLADAALRQLSPTFDRMYAARGRHSIPPERLLKASLLIALYSIRSERQLCEQLEYNLLFRWFLDMDPWEPVFAPTTFTKNRQRLLRHTVGQELFDTVVAQAHQRGLLSDEHFTVDGTLIEAAASMKSFQRKDGCPPPPPTDADPGNPSVDFHGEKRSNATHQSTTDPEARLYKKARGKEAKLAFLGHAFMENRHGMLVDVTVTQASGTAERDVVPGFVARARARKFRPTTLGGDKAYDTRGCVQQLRQAGVTPHVARNTERTGGSAIDGRTTRHAGYTVSQRIRKRVEEIFGWMKTVGGLRKTRYRGVARVGLWAMLVGTAYNLVRMQRLLGAPATA
jgi:transposase